MSRWIRAGQSRTFVLPAPECKSCIPQAEPSRGCAFHGSALMQHVQSFWLQMGLLLWSMSRGCACERVCCYTACLMYLTMGYIFLHNVSRESTCDVELFSYNMATKYTDVQMGFCAAFKSWKSIYDWVFYSLSSSFTFVWVRSCTVCPERSWIRLFTACLEFSPLYGSVLVQHFYRIHWCAGWVLYSMWVMTIHLWVFPSMSRGFMFQWVCSCTICPENPHFIWE